MKTCQFKGGKMEPFSRLSHLTAIKIKAGLKISTIYILKIVAILSPG
jgi:hypothetical protein